MPSKLYVSFVLKLVQILAEREEEAIREIQVLKALQDFEGVTQLVTYGKSSTSITYIIMKKCGASLKEILTSQACSRFSLKTTVQIGLQLIDSLKGLHDCGYTHLDLKPSNVLLTDGDLTKPGSSLLTLIDFGFSSIFVDDQGHGKKTNCNRFIGNFLFASRNAFRFF
jgi:serine/threonine protein kinase